MVRLSVKMFIIFPVAGRILNKNQSIVYKTIISLNCGMVTVRYGR